MTQELIRATTDEEQLQDLQPVVEHHRNVRKRLPTMGKSTLGNLGMSI